MSILKLEPGDRVTFTVVRTEEVQGKFGPQIKFVGTTPTDDDAALFLNVDAATRQLSRIGYGLDTVIGNTVEIARTEKNGTKYTDINRPYDATTTAGQATPSRPVSLANARQPHSAGPHIPGLDGPRPVAEPAYGDVPAQQAAVDALRTGKLDMMFVTYRLCFREAVSVAKELPTTVTPTHEGLSAMAATLYIQAAQKGLGA